jgi:hypothetical protein
MSGVKRTVLLVHLQGIDVPHHLGPAIASVTASTAEALVIVLVSQLFHTAESTSNRVQQWDRVQSLLTYVYVKATKAAQDLGKVLLDISVVLKDPSQGFPSNFGNGMDMCFRIQGGASLSSALSVHTPHGGIVKTPLYPISLTLLGPFPKYSSSPINSLKLTGSILYMSLLAVIPPRHHTPSSLLVALSITCMQDTKSCSAWQPG